jgi:hypothetical protein
MSRDKIANLMNSVAKILENNEKLVIPVLSVKLRKIAETHPYDQTIVAMYNVISKLEDNNKSFISRGELKDLYNKLYVSGTKFSEYFRDEVGEINHLATPKLANKNEASMKVAYDKVADPILSNALDSLFDKKMPQFFSKEIGKKAISMVSSNLDVWNLSPSKIDVENGNDTFMVIKADYDTPKGITSIFVPVEVIKNKVIEPSLFVGNSGPQELNHTNIKNYLATNAGNKLNIKANDILNLLVKASTENRGISEVELAITKMNASKETAAPFFADMVINQVVPAAVKNAEVVLPKLGEFESFSEKFKSPLGFANFKFGVNKVNSGRDAIVRVLADCGMKNPQINVSDANDSVIVYAVSLNGGTLSFSVPIKFANNRVINPENIVCNGSILPFDKNSLANLMRNQQSDFRAAAVASPGYGLKPSELINNVREAMVEENYAKAEDALNILAQSGDTTAYKNAFTIYINGLNSVKTAAKETKCSMIVNTPNSKYAVCGHTGLPLHKTYIDKFGNCQPNHRRGLEESDASAYFMNSKIFG